MRAAIAIALLLTATPAVARERLVRVPFVGCPSGGMTGLQPAPAAGKPRWLKKSIGRRLAYYSPGDIGVVAPRGWHCAAVYGSSGEAIIVVPDRKAAEAFRRLRQDLITGPFVWAGVSEGGTSGRGPVMEAIARYFPSHRDFIRKVRQMDLFYVRLPNGPYPSDVIKQETSEFVRFTTPAWRNGEAVGSMIKPNAMSVEGFRELVGPRTEPDLRGVDVRLPATLSRLALAILKVSR